MLINFFKNIFPSKYQPAITVEELGYSLYKKFNAKNKNAESKLYSIIDNEPSVCDSVLDSCLIHAINHNDLSLIEKLYPYMKRNHRELNKDLKDHFLFNYAKNAVQSDKIDIFDYFIKLYHDKHAGLTYVANHSPWEFTHLIDVMIESKKVHYFNILEHYALFNCHNYLESYISGDSCIKRDNIKSLNFMLDNFPIEKHKENAYEAKTIDLDKLLLAACRSSYFKEDIVVNLVNRGANVNCYQSSPLFYLIQKENLNMVQFLLEKGAKIVMFKIHDNNEINNWLINWKQSKELLDELSDEMIVNNDNPIKSKKNKL